jgi:phosphate transport system permease protein
MTSPSSPLPEPSESLWRPNRIASKRTEKIVQIISGICAFVSVATTIGIILTLIFETVNFFGQVSIIEFFTATEWTPLFAEKHFGIFVLISATFMTTVIAMCVALPLGLLAAICLSEYAPLRLRKWLKPTLEVLAGVPSVVYGYFALTFVTPQVLKPIVPGLETFNSLSAGLVMGISILPLVASLSEDAIYSVPQSMRQGAYALGATKREVVLNVVIPAALSGIVASVILAISRAVGETMIVTLAAGARPTFTLDPRIAVMTMTAFIVQVTGGDAPVGSIAYITLFAVGTTLFVITLVLNVFSFWFVRRFREKYE